MSVRFLLYLLLAGLTYALYSFYAMTELLFLLIILIALPLCSFFLLFIARYFVHVDMVSDTKEIYRLNPFELELTIQNRGPFYFPAVRIEFNLPKEEGYIVSTKSLNKKKRPVPKMLRFYPFPHLAAENKVFTNVVPQFSISQQKLSLVSLHRGAFEVGTSSILLQDLFGFFFLPLPRMLWRDRKSGKKRLVQDLEVLPNPNYWNSPTTGKLQAPEEVLLSKENLKVSNEVDTLANVREYRPGDRIKQIHWKLSARIGSFLSREFEDPRQGGILFVLDPKYPDAAHAALQYADEASEIMAATMKIFSRKEGPLALRLGEDFYTSPGEGVEPINFYRAMIHWKPEIKTGDPRWNQGDTRLACIRAKNRLELTSMLEKELLHQRYRAVIIVSARMDKNLAKELYRNQKKGSQILLIFLHNENKQDLQEILRPISGSSVTVFPTQLTSLKAFRSISGNKDNANESLESVEKENTTKEAKEDES